MIYTPNQGSPTLYLSLSTFSLFITSLRGLCSLLRTTIYVKYMSLYKKHIHFVCLYRVANLETQFEASTICSLLLPSKQTLASLPDDLKGLQKPEIHIYMLVTHYP